ncbi:MAG: PilN domain-containing protein [Chthoniobacteraceae bacterium]
MSKPGKNRERLLVRQIEGEAWEIWAMGEGGQVRLKQACMALGDARISPQSVLALPLRQSFAVPLWLATTDVALMKAMVFLQLERRGFVNGRSLQESVFDYRIIKSAENKTLVLAVALPGALPGQLCLDLQKYEPSARTHVFPMDEFVLWHEGDRLVLAVTQGSELVYFEVLGADSLTEEVVRELQCIKLQLEAENVINGINGITLWTEFSQQETSLIAGALDSRVRSDKRPAPVMPSEWMDLMPSSVRQSQGSAKIKERKKALVAAIAGVYLLFLVFLILRAGWFYIQCRRIEADMKNNQPVVEQLEATAHRWDLLDAAINPESYPIEQLRRCAGLLPPDGVRFTLFKATGDKIFIQGEAKSAPSAFKFVEDLKQSKDLADYKWEMPQPKLLPNDNAEFQVEGVK